MLSRPKEAGVSPIVSSASATRVWLARQSRKKSCPANSAIVASEEEREGEGFCAIAHILAQHPAIYQSFVLQTICQLNQRSSSKTPEVPQMAPALPPPSFLATRRGKL